MAIKYFCDRCGANVPAPENVHTRGLSAKSGPFSVKVECKQRTVHKAGEAKTPTESEWDALLCANCIAVIVSGVSPEEALETTQKSMAVKK